MKVRNTARLISGPLRTERLSDGDRKLLRDLVVGVGPDTYHIPEGFVSDFSSIPTALFWIVRWSKVDIAGVVHDYIYETAIENRAKADKVWYLVAIAGEHRANLVQGWVCWFGLLMGGWWFWWKYRKAELTP